MSICHEPVSKPRFFGLLLSRPPHGADDLEGELGSSPLGPRVTLIENFASHAAVQEFVDVKPD